MYVKECVRTRGEAGEQLLDAAGMLALSAWARAIARDEELLLQRYVAQELSAGKMHFTLYVCCPEIPDHAVFGIQIPSPERGVRQFQVVPQWPATM
jgi:hypothetical protein